VLHGARLSALDLSGVRLDLGQAVQLASELGAVVES